MDTVSRRRRSQPAGELEAEAAARDLAYQTALSQPGITGEAPGGIWAGEASPGTLESGGIVGQSGSEQLPVANPFHSERVKQEVNLIRSRPTTLDTDAARFHGEVDEAALGDSWTGGVGEPDYSAMMGQPTTEREAPRVARVEPSAAGQPASVVGNAVEGDTRLSGSKPGMMPESGMRVREERTGGETDPHLAAEEPEAGRVDDPRELIPASADRLTRVEMLLTQVLEENQVLRRQIQAESHSSYHSTRTPADLSLSPMSFGLGSRFPEGLPTSPYGVQSVDHCVPHEFPGTSGRFRALEYGPGVESIPGEQHSFARARPPQVPSVGMGGLIQGELVPGLSSGVVRPEPQPVPPPVAPLGMPVAPEASSIPQTMRQFASVVLQSGTEQGEQGYHTPRSGAGVSGRFDSEGYPVSPGGTSIKPPALPPPPSAYDYGWPTHRGAGAFPGATVGAGFPPPGFGGQGVVERPEEPAKYIDSLPKLAQADLSVSAVTCGNWLAQVKQIFVGLSPSAVEWYDSVEAAAYGAYNRWLVADPLGRLAVDPSSVVAGFNVQKFQRVESRAVTLLLAALPASVKDDLVMNRWLSSSSILFRVLCIWQPGGSNERAHLLSQLVQPEACKGFREALPTLRRWQQNLQRAREIHATLPDPSLLLRGIDQATSAILSSSPMIAFRVNAFRHRSGLDYNPSVVGIVQLVRLIQAEFEAASLVTEGNPEKRPRNAAAVVPPPKAEAPVPSLPRPSAEVLPAVAKVQPGDGDVKGGKAKGKGKGEGSSEKLEFSESAGCRYGDSCIFKHDRAKARKEGRCLACGQSGHFRPECPNVAPENRAVQDSGSDTSPGASSGSGVRPAVKSKAKAKAGVSKGVIEESPKGEAPASVPSSGGGASASPTSPEALVAEAAKLLKGVSLKPIRLEDVDLSWVNSALTSAADPDYCLIDSGATNALRPAKPEELLECRKIRVDLASGEAELCINNQGTLLHGGGCQVILPANYLIELGYTIAWRKRGCRVKHPRKGSLEVTLVKGCPLIPKGVGLDLLQEYEALGKERGGIRSLGLFQPEKHLDPAVARMWLRERLIERGDQGLTEIDQVTFLSALCPAIPKELISKVCVSSLGVGCAEWDQLPWNRRKRRSIARAKPGEVMISCSNNSENWKGQGRTISVSGSEKGLGSRVVFRQLLQWAESGVIGGIVQALDLSRAGGGFEDPETNRCWETLLRILLLFSVAQAAKDCHSPDTTAVSSAEYLEGEAVEESSPEGIKDPHELLEWALKTAAARLARERAKGTDPSLRSPGADVFLAFEWPCKGKVSQGASLGECAVWTDGFGTWKEVYGLHFAEFDQGCLGSCGDGVTGLLTSSWFLFEALHRIGFARGVQLRERSTRGKGTGWASGLWYAIKTSWKAWKEEGLRAAEIAERRVLLSKLTEAESYARHVANDHVPFRKGCPVCVGAQGRRRAHWRTSHPGVHSASFDLAGPFLDGLGYDPEASGRDRGRGYRYFLACSYTVPGRYEPLLAKDADCPEYAPSEPGEVLEEEPRDIEDLVLFGDLEALPESVGDSRIFVKVVDRRVRSKKPESSPVQVELPRAEVSEVPKAVGTRTLFLGTPLRSKKGREVMLQVQGIINRLESSGFPVQRFHADRAKELRSASLLGWLKEIGIHPTWTPGDAPAGNRAELAVQSLKGGVRKLLNASGLARECWPLALLHASSRNWVTFLEQLGIPQPVLLPFGVEIHARKRFKTGYKEQWRSRTVAGVYLGIAPNTPGGHLVLVPDGEDKKVLLTGTVYPLRGERLGEPKKPKYRLVGKRSPDFAVRVVAAVDCRNATVLAAVSEARFSPGGESSPVFPQLPRARLLFRN